MSDLFDDPREGENAPEFSVTELSGAIKQMIEGEFSHVRIRGEIGRVSFPRSGHVYLDLKDDRSVIAAVMWKGVAARVPTRPEEGLEVVATGRLTTFPGQSKYQLVIEDLKPAGMGALMAMLEKRRAMLQAEGLFDPERKKPLPYLPEVIGVVTSPSGAVIRDILHRLRDRFPRKVLIWPVAVQGERCAPEVARAIAGFNALTPGGALPRPDLLIVARGGGSIEDLWGFNEEIVVRAAAASQIPLISAVGHETDTTLIDHAADRRAPTPTAAAEMAVPVRLELLAWVDQQHARLSHLLSQGIGQRGQRLRDLSRALPRPDSLLQGPSQRLDILSDRLPQALIRGVQARRLLLSERKGGLRPVNLTRRISAEQRALATLAPRLGTGLHRVVEARGESLKRQAERLRIDPLQRELRRAGEELNRLSHRLAEAGQRQIGDWQARLEGLERLRLTLGYEATLDRGYAVVWDGERVLTSTAAATAASDRLEIQFADGRMRPREGAAPPPATPAKGGAAKPAPAGKTTPPEPGQGSLF